MIASERNNPSVIAKLMGLDDQQKPVYRQHRVLSDNYLRKSASIASYKKRSSKIKRKTNVDAQISCTGEIHLGNVKQLYLLDSYTTSGWEFKKQLLERSKRTKLCQENWFCKRVCKLNETPSMSELELKQRLKKLGTEVVIRGNEGWKDKSVTKLPIFKRFNLSSTSSTKFKKTMKGDLKSSCGRHNIMSSNSRDVDFSCCLDDPFEQDLLCEDGFMSLKDIHVGNELTRSTGDVYQPSPNSVLEPGNSSGSECGENVSTDLHGLWMKLEILKTESEENQSKCETVTLSYEDATERFFSKSQNIKPIRRFRPKESQQFSYLVDILNEFEFHGGKVDVTSERCIMNPLIFETLEKKYGEQNSWNRADRKLLFDRITLGLTDIFWSKPLGRKMSSSIRRDIIEEELWNMLLSQQKQVNLDLSEKAIGKEPWLELANEVDSIVEEIEAFLFNELATELVAIWRLYLCLSFFLEKCIWESIERVLKQDARIIGSPF